MSTIDFNQLKYLFIIYMGYLNGHSRIETSQKSHGVGFSLTADEHCHLNNKRLTNVSALVDNHDGTTKKIVTDLLKTKAATNYVNNELAKKARQSSVNKALAALNEKVKKLEATVGELQKALKRGSE